MALIEAARRQAGAAVSRYGQQVAARPVLTLATSGVVAGLCVFAIGAVFAVLVGDDPIPWGWYAKVAIVQAAAWWVMALLVRGRRSRR
ncbi:hypothetical protein FXF51_06380 [Nonomuraea sp. PA05]|uniref:hypothetical protein n=1 Tax=Nonomuraea sp. PA05 TaxID=2604466 RepID=UPI0011DBE071|nr:hypothetical protein [Nonomuraea sp. PA05]TYB69788.1 hypothetical protein FXF51_06380 [Nonomuraea sp. PA05]